MDSIYQKWANSLQLLEQISNVIMYFKNLTKNMKLTPSLTESTKQSQLQINLPHLETQLQPQMVTLFTEKNGKTYRVKLELESKTITKLILEGIEQFNTKYELKLSQHLKTYCLYPAKKNGKMCNDYPSLDLNQDIIHTHIYHYYLKDTAAPVLKQTIKSNFMWEKKQEMKQKKQNSSCGCLFR